MVVRELYEFGVDKLSELEAPKIDARAILEDVLGVEFGKLILHYNDAVTREVYDDYACRLEKRCRNMPLSYITNKKEFYSLSFYVKEGVLIPRPETENLVKAVLDNLPQKKDMKIADLCSGSGCIGITLGLKTGLPVHLYEVSEEAISVSKINCDKLSEKNIKITRKDILSEELEGKYDVIVSNPPYIPLADIPEIMPEVRDYEPKIALTDDGDGFKFYRRILELSKKHLNEGGILAVEVGINQHNEVKKIFAEIYDDIEIICDYFGIERVVMVKCRNYTR